MIMVAAATSDVDRHLESQPLGIGAGCGFVRIPHCAGLLGDVVRAEQLPLLDTLDACLDRVDAVFPVWPFAPACLNAATENTRRIVYLPSEGVGDKLEHQTDTTTVESVAKLVA